jgi:opacity protein-like surface antigen
MRRVLKLAIAVVLSCLPAFAQDHRVEVFGGYSLFVIDGDDLRRFGPVLSRLRGNDTGTPIFHGWDGELSLRVTPLISIVADVSGHYQNVTVVQSAIFGNQPNINIEVKTQMYNFLAGPRVSFKAGAVRPFAHVLVGLSHMHTDSKLADNSSVPSVNDNNFALALGGGIDLPITGSFSIRPLKLDYMLLKTDPNALSSFTTAPSPSTTSNLRYAAGVVFRF